MRSETQDDNLTGTTLMECSCHLPCEPTVDNYEYKDWNSDSFCASLNFCLTVYLEGKIELSSTSSQNAKAKG